jgi:Ring finger domain
LKCSQSLFLAGTIDTTFPHNPYIMSIVAALRDNIFQPRHLARWHSERVASTDETAITTEAADEEEGAFVNRNTAAASDSAIAQNNESVQPQPVTTVDAPPSDVEMGSATALPLPIAASVQANNTEDSEDSTESEDEVEETDDRGVARYTIRHTVSLAELEEERELARRRSSVCTLLSLFILFRLWILALQEGDFGLLLLCLVGSSWIARWIRHNRDQEEELDRRIANYLANPDAAGAGNSEVPRDDLRMLSFQAQLALAIMESQRQMMQGGYGHPDGNGNQTPGVSPDARAKWTKFAYKAARDKKESRRGSYGSVAQQDVVKPGMEEEPHCSICLGEYEEGEELSKLPCSHIYHDECITSWCSNHIRCPLCNYDLESEPASNNNELV